MQEDASQALSQILRRSTGSLKVSPSGRGINLPILVERQYDFFIVTILGTGKEILLAKPKQAMPLRIIEGHYQLIKKQFPAPVIIYFDHLPSRDRQQLLLANVQFMVADQFLYATDIGFFGENPAFNRSWEDFVEAKQLTPLAESILIGQLLDQRYEGLTGKMISEPLKVSAAAISQALAELERHRFVELKRSGKAKHIHFEDPKKLWLEVRQILTNPVESESVVASLPSSAVKAGLNALSEITMLADTDEPTYAVYKRDFNKAVKVKDESGRSFEDRSYRIQSWRRDPQLFAQKGRVDPISLYLSLRTFPDERVQKELKNLIGEVGLEHG